MSGLVWVSHISSRQLAAEQCRVMRGCEWSDSITEEITGLAEVLWSRVTPCAVNPTAAVRDLHESGPRLDGDFNKGQGSGTKSEVRLWRPKCQIKSDQGQKSEFGPRISPFFRNVVLKAVLWKAFGSCQFRPPKSTVTEAVLSMTVLALALGWILKIYIRLPPSKIPESWESHRPKHGSELEFRSWNETCLFRCVEPVNETFHWSFPRSQKSLFSLSKKSIRIPQLVRTTCVESAEGRRSPIRITTTWCTDQNSSVHVSCVCWKWSFPHCGSSTQGCLLGPSTFPLSHNVPRI